MTMRQMAASYRESAGLLYLRMLALQDAQKHARSRRERSSFEQRYRALKILYRETCETALVLERYCDRRDSQP